MFIIKLIFGIMLLFPSITLSHVKHYQAPYNTSKWMITSSKLFCQMSHEIPEYGKLIFAQQAGESEYSNLEVWYNRGYVHHFAEIQYTNPEWINQTHAEHAFNFQFPDNKNKILFSPRQTRQILDALDRNLYPTIIHRDYTNLKQQVIAQASLINFNKSYSEYIKCQASLIPITFTQARDSNILFDTASTRLDAQSTQLLEYILEYLKDPYIRRIDLAGYTDSIGSFRANHKLASERVEVVRDYLLNAGVDEKLIKLRVYGEHRPLKDNRNEHGRSLNRRVNIKILR